MSNLSKKKLIQNRYKIKELIKLIRYVTCGHEKRSKILRSEGAIIGSNCKIYPSASFGSEPYLIELGNDVRITAGVRITTHDGGIPVLVKSWKLKNAGKFGRVKIGNNVHIGINSVIMPGVTIGDNVIIWAGAVITKDIPSNSVAVGVPAKVIESIDDYYNKVKDDVIYIGNITPVEKRKLIENNLNRKI